MKSGRSPSQIASVISALNDVTGEPGKKSYTWEQVNKALFQKGWSPKRIADLSVHISKSKKSKKKICTSSQSLVSLRPSNEKTVEHRNIASIA